MSCPELRTLTAFLLVLLMATSCENKMEDIKQFTDKRTSVEKGYKIESFLSQAGKMKARLTAPVMNRYQTDSPYIEFPNRMHVDFSQIFPTTIKVSCGKHTL